MTEGEFTVRAYTDLEGARISSAGKDRVLAALEDVPCVVWLEDWLRDEKPLTPLEGARSLYGCTVQARTAKAWCVGQSEGENEVWVPRSQAELYERHEDGLAVDSGSPQASLRDWAP